MDNLIAFKNQEQVIPVNYDDDEPSVSGRALHTACGLEERYSKWFDRMCEYGFIEGIDYTPYQMVHPQNQQILVDHKLTIPMAKEIAMLQRSEKGKQVRQYLIHIEEAWNQPETIMARAVKLADSQLTALHLENEQQKQIIGEMRPKALVGEAVSVSEGSVIVGVLAKILEQNGYKIGQNRLFAWLRNNGYLGTHGANYNLPKQRYVEMGIFEVVETPVILPDGTTIMKPGTRVTGKGQGYFLQKFLEKENATADTVTNS